MINVRRMKQIPSESAVVYCAERRFSPDQLKSPNDSIDSRFSVLSVYPVGPRMTIRHVQVLLVSPYFVYTFHINIILYTIIAHQAHPDWPLAASRSSHLPNLILPLLVSLVGFIPVESSTPTLSNLNMGR